MATFYSDGFTKIRSGRRLQANEAGGKARVLTWDFASLAASTLGDLFVCGLIKARERVILGRESHSAMGGSATGAYGTYAVASDGVSIGAVDSAGRFLAAITHVAAGTNLLADTIAQNVLFEAPTDLFLVITNAGSAMATAGRLTGFLLLASD